MIEMLFSEKFLVCTVIVCAFKAAVLLSSTSPVSPRPIIHIEKFNCTLDETREFALNYGKNSKVDHAGEVDTKNISLELTNCTLPILTVDLLTPLNVIRLSVTNSKVSILSDSWLNQLRELEELQLSGNRFRELQSWSKEKLYHLVELCLGNNQISRIGANALRQYPNLQRLNLAHNRIEMLPDGLFTATLDLKWLNLMENSIRRIEAQTFKSLLMVEELHLENNIIEYINPFALATNLRVRELHLEGNRITTVDILLYNLPRLSYLNFGSNKLESKSLDANTFHQNHELQVLDLSFNRLRKLKVGTFNGLSSLRVLDISNNELLYIQSMTLSPLPSVTHLDASNNNISYIMDNQFVYLGSAEQINLSHNKIDNIQQYSFVDLPELKVLDLSHNRIFDDEFFTGLTSLNVLNLSYNHFDAFDSTYLQSIKNVNLRNNPLGCSWLFSEIVNTDFDHIQLGELVGNGSMSGIKPEEIKCHDYDNDSPQRTEPIVRHVVVIRKTVQILNDEEMDRLRTNFTDEEGFLAMSPRFLANLFTSGEFSYRMCLLWTGIAVVVVLTLLIMGHYCLRRSERKSEKFRLTKQERVQKDIEEYFARMNSDTN